MSEVRVRVTNQSGFRYGGRRYSAGDELEVPERIADRYGSIERLEPDTCTVEISNGPRTGEECGRDRPCQFHDS